MKAKVRKTGEIVEVLSFVAPLGTGRTSDDNGENNQNNL